MKYNSEIHWWHFPNNIFILLKDGYRESLFQESNYRIAKRLKVSVSAVRAWKYAKWDKYVRYTPIGVLKKLHELYNIPFSQTEKHIVSYSACHGGHIDYPKLPIKESPDLFQIIGHFFGDGSANKIKMPSYCNTSTQVRNEFKRLLYSVFGKVMLKEYSQNHTINFPRAISRIIMHSYKINDFGTFASRIPRNIKTKNPYLLKGIIKAFIIDEGSIRDSGIDIYSANINLLTDLQQICSKLKYKCGCIRRGAGCYYFKILSQSIPKLIKDLSPIPYEKKNKRLNFILERQNRNWDHKKEGFTKQKIIELLTVKPRTIFELALELSIAPKTIGGYHLKKLEKERIVKRDTSNKEHIWNLK